MLDARLSEAAGSRTLRSGMSDDRSGPKGVGRVMVATDRSETAERAVRWAAAMAERYEAELYLVQVVMPRNPAAAMSRR